MSSFAWGECGACSGGGKVWPKGPRMPSVACTVCRGIGHVCTAAAGPSFDAKTGAPDGGVIGTHPLGDCLSCQGLVTQYVRQADQTTLTRLDLADTVRSQNRRMTGMAADLGEQYERKFLGELQLMGGAIVKALKSSNADIDTSEVEKLLGMKSDAPKQLGAGDGVQDGEVEEGGDTSLRERIFGKKDKKKGGKKS